MRGWKLKKSNKLCFRYFFNIIYKFWIEIIIHYVSQILRILLSLVNSNFILFLEKSSHVIYVEHLLFPFVFVSWISCHDDVIINDNLFFSSKYTTANLFLVISWIYRRKLLLISEKRITVTASLHRSFFF